MNEKEKGRVARVVFFTLVMFQPRLFDVYIIEPLCAFPQAPPSKVTQIHSKTKSTRRMAANGMTNVMGSTLFVPALRPPALPDAAAPAPASQQDTRVPLPESGNDYDVSMDLTAHLAGIIDVSEEARLRAQAWRFEQTFEVRAEQHFGSRLVEYERNKAERTWWEVGANRAEVTSALEAVAANNAQLVAQGNIAFEQRDRALRQTVRQKFDGYCAHLAMEMQEDIPAHYEARIVDVCDFFREQFNEGAVGWNGMPVSTVKCLQWHCARRRIAS